MKALQRRLSVDTPCPIPAAHFNHNPLLGFITMIQAWSASQFADGMYVRDYWLLVQVWAHTTLP